MSAPRTAWLIERELPGAAQLTEEELDGMVARSTAASASLDRPCVWRHSYVAGDKLYCVFEADGVDVVLAHARRCGFPVHLVSEVARVLGPGGVREMPD